MKIYRLLVGAMLALPLLGAASADPASADHRWRLRLIQPQFWGYEPRPHWLPRRSFDRRLDDEFYEELEDEAFEDDYYEPRYAEPDEDEFDGPPAKPAKKKKKKTVNKERPSDGQTTKQAAKLPASKSEPIKKKTEAPSSAGKAVNCDRAAKIVSSYGFGAVTAKSCTGKIYSFNASRGGKSYEIKLSSASGELTEVRKVQ